MQKIVLTSFLSLCLLTVLSSCNKQEAADPRCSRHPDPGMCQAAFVRYYYDKEAKMCKPFTWGGCGGVVPFETLEECKSCECNK